MPPDPTLLPPRPKIKQEKKVESKKGEISPSKLQSGPVNPITHIFLYADIYQNRSLVLIRGLWFLLHHQCCFPTGTVGPTCLLYGIRGICRCQRLPGDKPSFPSALQGFRS